ncbi:MAG: 50S ribosomal protein L18 [Chloroflexi bacterium]|nr:MAG: 50S ribosomal protein L18 [Chloroflexota bacterium]TME97927.1 MAG: 50S ribosomal protein L18 [Chloroflexota bacterium]TMF68229.1 MAG: 50S ribosomal protein L18 [Chloroflexota bacterium]TMG35263.1 MAG: 50S ribosomal protein L18 [Chloroflexota bacterium]
MPKETRRESRTRRHERVRDHIRGSAARPRLAVFRSLSHIYAQLIDDEAGKTLVAASSGDVKDAKGSKTERAKAVGTTLGERAKAKGIAEAVFDRGGYRYHGRVKALGDGARSAGLRF